MPRSRKKAKTVTPATEPKTVAEVLEKSPVAELLASREAKALVEPERPMPEPDDADKAVAAFQRQREREQAVAEPPSAEKPVRPQKTWGETVRPWTTHGRDTGVHHVTTTSPDMVGIRFDKGKERTPEEKREMEAIDLRFFTEAQAWLKSNRDGAFDETQDLARKFAERRRQAEANPTHER